MVVVVPAAVAADDRPAGARSRRAGLGRRRGRATRRPTAARYAEGAARERRGSRSACRGRARNLRALVAAGGRGELGGDDRARVRRPRVPGARLGGGAGHRHGPRARAATTTALADDARRGRARRRRPRRLPAARRARGAGRRSRAGSSTSTRRCCRRSPGAHAVRDALAAGVARHRRHRPPRRRDARRRPDRARRRPCRVLPGRRRGVAARADPRRSSTGCCPRGGDLLAGALAVAPGARRARIDPAVADARRPCRAGRCSRSPTRPASPTSRRGLVARGFELVSTGGTARALREAGLPVTDVAAVTGFPEMLDGRVKTLHPRIHAGHPRRPPPRRPPRAAGRRGDRPVRARRRQPLPVRRGRRAARASRFDELVEEIDIGGPSMVRAAAKNHASVAIVTSPGALRRACSAALDERRRASRSACGRRSRSRRSGTPPPTTPGSPPSCPRRMAAAGIDLPDEPGPARAPTTRTRRRLTIALEKVETLRYGENPHQPAARYRRTGPRPAPGDGPFAAGEPPLQGKALCYNNVLDASAAAALARLLRGPAVRDRQAHEPVRRRRARRRCSRPGRPRSPATRCRRSAASSRSPGPSTRALAERLTSIFLEVVVAPAFDAGALRDPRGEAEPARSSSTRALGDRGRTPRPPRPARARSGRPAARSSSRRRTRAPTTRRAGPVVTTRAPDRRASARDLDLAWRLCRGVMSNAIVLVRGRHARRARLGPDVSRVDACPQAVEKARAVPGRGGRHGRRRAPRTRSSRSRTARSCCSTAGVTAFVQPGGSMRDAEVLAAVDAAGAAMLRHRHAPLPPLSRARLTRAAVGTHHPP